MVVGVTTLCCVVILLTCVIAIRHHLRHKHGKSRNSSQIVQYRGDRVLGMCHYGY